MPGQACLGHTMGKPSISDHVMRTAQSCLLLICILFIVLNADRLLASICAPVMGGMHWPPFQWLTCCKASLGG